MKRLAFLTLLLLGLGLTVAAQPRSFGLRAGSVMEVSYQHCFGTPHFAEVDLGMDMVGDHGLRATATYNWIFAEPAWGYRGEWAWYAGPGVSLGYVYEVHGPEKAEVMMAFVGQVGCEFTPWNHLTLSADLRPMIGFHFGTGKFYRGGLVGLVPSLGVRYKF